MAHPVTHFEINARDAKATQDFYRNVFGWGVDANNSMNYGIVDTHSKGEGIGGGIGESQDRGRSWITFYIETPDLDATLAKVARAGGRTVMPPQDAGMVVYAQFADPEGNVVGLARSAPPAPKPGKATAKRAPAKKKATAKRKTAARKATAKKTARRPVSRSRTRGR